jgi:hypothetical protein
MILDYSLTLSIFQELATTANHLDKRCDTRCQNFVFHPILTLGVLPDMMIFAQMNDDVVLDKIPLAEIKQVQEMLYGENENSTENHESRLANQNTELMVETLSEGYNSGRTYYLKAESVTSCRDTVQILARHSKDAYKRANSQTVLSRTQGNLRTLAYSTVFQNIMALLIVTVSYQLTSASYFAGF